MLKFKVLSVGLLSIFLFSAQSPAAQETSQAQTASDKKQSSASASQAQTNSGKKQLSVSDAEAEKIRVRRDMARKQAAEVDYLLGDLASNPPGIPVDRYTGQVE